MERLIERSRGSEHSKDASLCPDPSFLKISASKASSISHITNAYYARSSAPVRSLTSTAHTNSRKLEKCPIRNVFSSATDCRPFTEDCQAFTFQRPKNAFGSLPTTPNGERTKTSNHDIMYLAPIPMLDCFAIENCFYR